MSIIKRNKANAQQPAAPSQEESTPEVTYTPEAVEQGLVPDRRDNDRRRGYRRIEDRHLITRAHEEANAIRENAQREGYEEGLNQARAELDELKNYLAELMTGRDEVLASVADDIAPLAVEVAERIIKTEVSADEELIHGIVRDTIQKVGKSSKSILIKVHPDDVTRVKDDLKDEPIPNLQAEIMVMDDPTVDRGSCIVETNSGLIDASFSTRLQILRQLFGRIDTSPRLTAEASPATVPQEEPLAEEDEATDEQDS